MLVSGLEGPILLKKQTFRVWLGYEKGTWNPVRKNGDMPTQETLKKTEHSIAKHSRRGTIRAVSESQPRLDQALRRYLQALERDF